MSPVFFAWRAICKLPKKLCTGAQRRNRAYGANGIKTIHKIPGSDFGGTPSWQAMVTGYIKKMRLWFEFFYSAHLRTTGTS